MNGTPTDIETLLSYLREELPSEAAREVEQRLKDDDALRRLLLELSTEEAVLTDWAESERVSASLDDGAFEGEGVPESPSRVLRPAFRNPPIGWLVAAALLVIGLSSALWLSSSETQPAPGVALLVSSVDASWQDTDPQPGASLSAGSYQLMKGTVALLFADGAKVSIGGPAAFELKSAGHLHLERGNLVASIADEALGFVVTSPRSEVIDLGTEFGLSVDQTGRTDVHVLDGLVEVLPVDSPGAESGVTIAEGQARRFDVEIASNENEIPVASREALLGGAHEDGLGLQMLRGSVRIANTLSASDFTKKATGQNWIDLVAEKASVSLVEPLSVSIDSTGSYRSFETMEKVLPVGAPLDSYLLHFRPGSLEQVHGVIRFDRPIVAILCTGAHLDGSDSIFGISSVTYPNGVNPFRGLEPNGRPTAQNARATDPDWQPDEIVLSQDRHTLSIRAFANTARGYDQVRVLTLAE